MPLHGPTTTVAPSGAPVYLRMLCVASDSAGTAPKYRVAPNMLVYTDGKTHLVADNTKVTGAFTSQCTPDSAYTCIGVAINGVNTNNDSTAGRMFTVCVYGPCVLAGNFTGIAIGTRLHTERASSAIVFDSAPHANHTPYGHALATAPTTGPTLLLLETHNPEYHDGALVFFCAV